MSQLIGKGFLLLVAEILLCSFLASACKRELPAEPITSNQVSLLPQDVSITEVALRILLEPGEGTHIILTRNETVVRDFRPLLHDTTITDTGLSGSTVYRYQAHRSDQWKLHSSSEPLDIRTLDTTRQKFSWEEYMVGDFGGILADVAIINDTLIYGVGEIHLRDSVTGGSVIPYSNLLVWNGREVQTSMTFEPGYAFSTLYSIFSFAAGDIWVGTDVPEHWDGQKWRFYDRARGWPGHFWTTRIWGRSSRDLYVAGDSGGLCHFNGSAWQLIPTGVSSRLTGLSGTGSELWACGMSPGYFESHLLIINPSGLVETLWRRQSGQGSVPPYGYLLSSLWSKPGSDLVYLASGDAVYRLTRGTFLSPKKLVSLPSFPYAIAGTDHNNIILAGDYGRIWHFNGARWTLIRQPATNQTLYGAVAKGNLIAAVGADDSTIPSRAFLVIGRRL